MPNGEKVVIIDATVIDKITKEITKEIEKINPHWRHTISGKLLQTFLSIHKDDKVYFFGFNDVDLSG